MWLCLGLVECCQTNLDCCAAPVTVTGYKLLTVATGEGGALTSELTTTPGDTALAGSGVTGEVQGDGPRLTCIYKQR